MRIIDADELRLGKFVEPRTEWHKGWNDALDAASTQTPTITPDSLVKRGRWLGTHDGVYYSYSCSECGAEALTKEETIHDQVLSKYCPNCGAMMDENGALMED